MLSMDRAGVGRLSLMEKKEGDFFEEVLFSLAALIQPDMDIRTSIIKL